jgi:ribosomal protein L13
MLHDTSLDLETVAGAGDILGHLKEAIAIHLLGGNQLHFFRIAQR